MSFDQKNIVRFLTGVVGILIITVSVSVAQPIIPIESSHNALVLNVTNNNDVNTIYFGKKLAGPKQYASQAYNLRGDYTNVLNAAYTPSGSRNLMEPAITVTHVDGNTSLSLRYVSHKVKKISQDVCLYIIKLKDPVYPFYVKLFYKVYKKEDVFEQWSTITHHEKGDVKLYKFASANLYLQAKNYWLKSYHGNWAHEMQPELSKLTHGIKTIDSKLGTRANLFEQSVFMVGLGGRPREDKGQVLLGGMEWTGNFRMDFELDYLNNLRLIAGMNDYASTYSLKPSETFKTPKFWYTLSGKGEGHASRNIHDWARKYKIVNGNGSRLTLLNNWEATHFNFDQKKLFQLIDDTKKLGVDFFLLDDGWFGNKYPRNNARAGLGDWKPNKNKLPNGISPLVNKAKKDDVKFGIWVEPEMVNPNSKLYHEHPEWVVKQPQRKEHYFRHQLVLDLSNPDVQDYVFGVVNWLLEENPKLAFIKWDANAVIYNAHSYYLKDQSEFYIKYVRGFYNVLRRLRAKHRDVPMMLCSGGGGRVDYGALQYFTEFWPSDNTRPLDRIYMKWEYSYFFPAISIDSHVTKAGHASPKFRADVAMTGKLGFDLVVDKLKPKDLKFYQQTVHTYNNIKPIIWHGDLYRLVDPRKHDVGSLMYMNKAQTQGVMFSYLVGKKATISPIKLKGLLPDARYSIHEINLYPGTQSTIDTSRNYSGKHLMQVGFNTKANKQRKSVVLKIHQVK